MWQFWLPRVCYYITSCFAKCFPEGIMITKITSRNNWHTSTWFFAPTWRSRVIAGGRFQWHRKKIRRPPSYLILNLYNFNRRCHYSVEKETKYYVFQFKTFATLNTRHEVTLITVILRHRKVAEITLHSHITTCWMHCIISRHFT